MATGSSSRERTPLLGRRKSSTTDVISRSNSSHTLPNAEGVIEDLQPAIISKARGALIAGSIGLLIFTQAINISILTTTQSPIAADLDAFENVTWLTSSYLIAMSSLAPLMGRLSQVFSPRLCIFSSTLLVCLGTTITSLSNSLKTFLAGRVITGAGSAGVLVVAAIIVIQTSGAKNRGLYLGLINTCMTVGVSLGAIIAGAVEPRFGWKPLFGLQTPFALLAGFGILFGIPRSFVTPDNLYTELSFRQKLARIDYLGSVLLIVTITLFLLGLSGPRVLPLPLIFSAMALPLFILAEIRVAHDPIIPITVLKSRGTLLTCFATVGFMMARWCLLFYSPVYALAVRGMEPALAGSILVPTNFGFAAGGLLAGVFHIRRTGSFYLPTLLSMALFPVTLFGIALSSTAESPFWVYVALVFCNGLFTGAALNYALVHLLHLTIPEIHPIALSLLATFRGFAGSFGSAIGGGLFTRVLQKSLVDGFGDAGLVDSSDLVRRLLGSPSLVSKLHGREKEVAIHAYENGLRAVFLGGMGLAIAVVFLQAGTGWREAVKRPDEHGVEADAEGEAALVGGS